MVKSNFYSLTRMSQRNRKKVVTRLRHVLNCKYRLVKYELRLFLVHAKRKNQITLVAFLLFSIFLFCFYCPHGFPSSISTSPSPSLFPLPPQRPSTDLPTAARLNGHPTKYWPDSRLLILASANSSQIYKSFYKNENGNIRLIDMFYLLEYHESRFFFC